MHEGFPDAARQLLDPCSYLSQKYPHLHQAFQYRLEIALAYRNHAPISRCDHTMFHGYEIGRNDGLTFQHQECSAMVDFLDPIPDDNIAYRATQICKNLSDRVEIYGTLGYGSFGAVYLARDKCGPADDPRTVRHFAVKVERHSTLYSDEYFGTAPVAAIHDYANEARFPKLDSVYIHDRYQAIVMSACVDPALDRWSKQVASHEPVFPAFMGAYLMPSDNKPILDEMAACKVASQLLQALVDMAQINLVHDDLSVNNFVVDQNLNVQLIDLGNVCFGLDDEDFVCEIYPYLPFQEYQMLPELAERMFRPENRERDWSENIWVDFNGDVRQIMLWKFGVIVYGLLHGYWPWDNPPYGGHEWQLLDYRGEASKRIHDRRLKIIREALPIRKDLSQDCKDVLRHLLQKDPAKRPSLESMTIYPWFSQWSYQNRIYERPFSQDFQNAYCRSTQ